MDDILNHTFFVNSIAAEDIVKTDQIVKPNHNNDFIFFRDRGLEKGPKIIKGFFVRERIRQKLIKRSYKVSAIFQFFAEKRMTILNLNKEKSSPVD